MKLHLRIVITLALLLTGILSATAQTNITLLSQITDANGHYVITQDITGGTPGVSTFNGTLEANIDPDTKMPYRIKNLSAPLFTALTGTVKNLVLENVNISSGTDVGAIACTANVDARIYNVGILSGSVGGSNHVGGLVGLLDGSARVINCYSFANITNGTVKAGIVGYNNYASKYNDLKTMVMNCMFYGDITTGGTIVPIYGGQSISNDYKASNSNRLNNYNYYRYESPYSKSKQINKYNCALPAEERFLVRFEFFRHLLNSTRELAAWYATGTATQSSMLKWVLDKNIAPYPVLKEQGKYPSVVNYDTTYTYIDGAKQKRDTITVRNHGGKLGTLTVYISKPSTPTAGQAWPSDVTIQSSVTCPILDKDTANYNFNYRKIQLPYYNDVGDKNYTSNKVVTGWMITGFTNGTQGSYTETNYDYPNYNYADRSTYAKDLYSVSHRIFSQGGYFNVPDGVTAITIEPYWGKAVYLSDACYDRYGYNNTDDLTQIGGGQRYTNDNYYSINGDNQKVYTTIGNALGKLGNASSVYDNAVVLVGNYHHHTTEGQGGSELASNKDKAFTIMSIDLNRDNEPDYSLIFRSGKQKTVSPIRYDFLNIPGMAMAHKMATHGDLAIPGNCKPLGWFEITTTALIRYNQFEYDSELKSILAPVIMMGGVIEQFISSNGSSGASHTKYLLFGDNVWFKLLSNGCHMEKKFITPRIPISITGGDYEDFYLSGYFAPDASVNTDNAEGYIDGGRFGEVAGAGQEAINGNVTWLINHADIREFYGGGINAAKTITGNITTTIDNSYVNFFCGGPKFGNMSDGKTVTTTATGTTFGKYFGAGYGGTSIYRNPDYKNVFNLKNYPWRDWIADSYDKASGNYRRGIYRAGQGVSCGFSYEFFGGSANNVARLYILYASFSLAQCNNVTSTLTDCNVLTNYYGGGSLGAVAGDATSTLNNTTVYGNVFGAGYSVQIPTVNVLSLGGFTAEADRPYYNENTAMYEKGTYPDTVVYTWANESVANSATALVDDGGNHTIKTNESLSSLGAVSGNVTLTLKGTTAVGTEGNANTGHVYGGGDESAVTGNTTVNLEEGVTVQGNVYGGGNQGAVSGNSEVKIE